MTNVAGIFNSKMEADKGLATLLDAGFKKEDISLIVNDNARHTIFAPPTDDEGERATRGGAAGALWGGALGVLAAGLTAVGSIAVPGAGLFAAGPIIAILAGAGTGAAVGGLSGALISAGFAVDEAKKFEHEVTRGKAVVIVHASDEKAHLARTALRNSDASIRAA